LPNELKKLISKFVGEHNNLIVPKPFIQLLDGDINAAILLSQLCYWADRTGHVEGWVYKTYENWYEEICLTKYQVSRASSVLKSAGIIETKVMKISGNPTVHYRILDEPFSNWLVKFLDEGKLTSPKVKKLDKQETELSITTKPTSINKREAQFRAEVITSFSSKYPEDMLTKFCDYWTEPNKSKTKMLWEMKPTFEIGRRLATWASRSGFESKQPQTEEEIWL